jgi:electron transfer flavoprotein alpha subunit
MTTLILAEHNNSEVNAATLNAVTAAQAIGGDITVLVAGKDCGAAAADVAKIDGVAVVKVVDAPEYENGLAENVA